MIKAVVFDCYGVFYVDPVFAYINDPDSPPELAREIHDLDKQLVCGIISQRDFIIKVSGLLNISESEARKRFFVLSARNKVLLEYAQELRKDYKVGMLSNVGSEAMNEYFNPKERDKYFDSVVLSGDVGFSKPDPRIFQLMCEKLGVECSEAVMIDDLPDFCEGARQTGMQAIVYISNKQLKRDIETLLE